MSLPVVARVCKVFFSAPYPSPYGKYGGYVVAAVRGSHSLTGTSAHVLDFWGNYPPTRPLTQHFALSKE